MDGTTTAAVGGTTAVADGHSQTIDGVWWSHGVDGTRRSQVGPQRGLEGGRDGPQSSTSRGNRRIGVQIRPQSRLQARRIGRAMSK